MKHNKSYNKHLSLTDYTKLNNLKILLLLHYNIKENQQINLNKTLNQQTA